MSKHYRNVTRDGDLVEGEESYMGNLWHAFSANWRLLRIDTALDDEDAFRRIWNIQDGYGSAGYTPIQGYDWSAIRDSSPEAVAAMDAVASEYVSDEDMERMLGLDRPRCSCGELLSDSGHCPTAENERQQRGES